MDGDTLSVISTTTPSNGTVIINTDGSLSYTPNNTYTGSDSFSYSISDGNGGTDAALVSISISDKSSPSLVCPDPVSVNNDQGICGAEVTFELPQYSDNSGYAELVQTAGPASGEVFSVGVTTVTFSATDATGNSVSCSFTVTVNDTES